MTNMEISYRIFNSLSEREQKVILEFGPGDTNQLLNSPYTRLTLTFVYIWGPLNPDSQFSVADRDDYALLVLFHNLPRCKVAWGSENMKDKRKCKKKCYKRNIYVIFIRQMDADTHRHLKFLHLVVVSPVKRERAQQTKGQWMLHVYQGCFLHETEGFVKYSFSRVWPLYIPAFHACCQSMSSLSQLCLCDLSTFHS